MKHESSIKTEIDNMKIEFSSWINEESGQVRTALAIQSGCMRAQVRLTASTTAHLITMLHKHGAELYANEQRTAGLLREVAP